MRPLLAPLVLLVSLVSAHAQLSSLPLPSSDDGALITRFSDQASYQTGWTSSALTDYKEGNGSPFVTPAAGSNDIHGRSWDTVAPDFANLNNSGGTLRVIFLGPADSSLTSFGYTYDQTPTATESFALSDGTGNFSPSSFAFGDSADISLLPGEFNRFDLWADTASNVYTLFNPANSSANPSATAQILWTQAPLLIPTFLPTANRLGDIDTWIGSVVETPANGAGHEFRFAVQEFLVSGEPIGGTPVPEPLTYGIFGVFALVGLTIVRRLRR